MANLMMEGWSRLLSQERLRPTLVVGRSRFDARTPYENDYDRVIFSSSFRRLRNKAQVFSLEAHDFVRTRLTHTFEVSTIGRSMGEGVAEALGLPKGDIGTIVATACLLHDIGNPPFGHSGEAAIGDWFKENNDAHRQLKIVNPQQRSDLEKFEGNAQAFRIATRNQWVGTDFGMNLTVATLATLMKYPCGSHEVNASAIPTQKHGYFAADRYSFDRVRELAGLSGIQRHPLTYIMEAADDIAYVAGDIEDVFKMGLVNFSTMSEILDGVTSDESRSCVKKYFVDSYEKLARDLDAVERQQLAIQRFSQMAIRLMVKESIGCFVQNADSILAGEFDGHLVENMPMQDLYKALSRVMEREVYSHVEIAHREQASRKVIHSLLDTVVDEIRNRPTGSLAQRVYKTAPRNPGDPTDLSEAYEIALRATDYISGMTDGFALRQYQRLSAMGAHL